MTQAAKAAKHISGTSLYQKRARIALPLLVRQAFGERPIFYSDLAVELGMPNPRNLDYVLGSIGKTMEGLSKEWKIKVPPIQCLVINRRDYLPGKGIGWFISNKNAFAKMAKSQKRKVVQEELRRIYGYENWLGVLKALGLEPTLPSLRSTIDAARLGGWGGGEGEDHKRLKSFIAANPNLVGVKNVKGEIEFRLPSGDIVDVMFRGKNEWVAVEIKSAISDPLDIIRGIFQCIKYTAIPVAANRAIVPTSEIPIHRLRTSHCARLENKMANVPPRNSHNKNAPDPMTIANSPAFPLAVMRMCSQRVLSFCCVWYRPGAGISGDLLNHLVRE